MRRNITRVIGPGQLGSLVVRRATLGDNTTTTATVDNVPPAPVITRIGTNLSAPVVTQLQQMIPTPTVAPPSPSFLDKARAWFGGEAFNDTGISRGAVTAGGGLLVLIASMGRRR